MSDEGEEEEGGEYDESEEEEGEEEGEGEGNHELCASISRCHHLIPWSIPLTNEYTH